MSSSDQLRLSRKEQIINVSSKKQESDLYQALKAVVTKIGEKYGLCLRHNSNWYLKDIVESLRKSYPEDDFVHYSAKSFIRPDGGILSLLDKEGKKYPILISEVKIQGTNTQRIEEGLEKQSMGNVVERLGKNVICLRAALMPETIFPFVCFGYGCDFFEGSSILDRIVAIALFGELNTIHLNNSGEGGRLNRGSFYFREPKWDVCEMEAIMYDIAERSVFYYFSKYGQGQFVKSEQTE